MPKIKNISHITFICRNIEKTGYMLKTLFGAEEIYSSQSKTFSLSREKFFKIGTLWIAIMEGKVTANKTYNHIAFYVSEKDLPKFRAKIRVLGLEVLPDRPRNSAEGKSLYFYD